MVESVFELKFGTVHVIDILGVAFLVTSTRVLLVVSGDDCCSEFGVCHLFEVVWFEPYELIMTQFGSFEGK